MNVELMIEPLQVMLRQIGEFLPRLSLALLILVAGWVLAKAVRFAVVRGLGVINFNVLTERAGMDGLLKEGGVNTDLTGIIGVLAYWFVILATLVLAFNGLGLTYVTDLIGKVMLFVPNVIVALLIFAFGSYFAMFVGNAIRGYCQKIGARDGVILGKIAQYALTVFIVLIALDQMNIGGNILRETFLIVLAGVVFGLSLAFGLGGRRWAARLLERWWPSERSDRADRPD